VTAWPLPSTQSSDVERPGWLRRSATPPPPSVVLSGGVSNSACEARGLSVPIKKAARRRTNAGIPHPVDVAV
jgi:hypothetical protein